MTLCGVLAGERRRGLFEGSRALGAKFVEIHEVVFLKFEED